FAFKLLFIGLAGVNVIVFYVTGLYRRVDGVGAGGDVPGPAKVAAAVSLFLWIGVMFWGRMLPFIGHAVSSSNWGLAKYPIPRYWKSPDHLKPSFGRTMLRMRTR